ncbi:hypothetical protein [Synechococcus sp. W4D4]|uniref:hypothetical protein n=1 Tax=Synechococcus sp. W4D4 TaxID=3392294 RepID=UPI0039E73675
MTDWLERRRYPSFGDDLLSAEDASRLIHDVVEGGNPFLVSRLGSVESRLLGEHLYCSSSYSRLTFLQAHNNAGIFPVTKSGLSQSAERLLAASGQVDLMGQWQTPYQARMISEHLFPSQFTALSSIEPWWAVRPWTLALKGKKILVIHPFIRTIADQYQRRAELFSGALALPDFSLLLVRPPQTLGGQTEEFGSWIQALDDLVRKVRAVDFDVALIGCGAYGLPLGAAIKAMGKPSIHLGGALQLLFGIRGRRWEAMPQYAALMNDSWVRPSPDETPRAANKVDGGCYW